jgi:hypothetical protein
MSFQIDTAFVKQFRSNIYMLLQQKGSRFRECVRREDQHAEEAFWEQVGPTEAQEITNRHGDSPLIGTPHDRRRVTLRFFDWGDLIDNIDKVRMLIDPTSTYALNATYALGRKWDDIFLAALFGTAYTGKAGATQVAFPAGQVVALNFGGGGNVGLTIPKLIEARRLLEAADVDLDDPENMAYIAVNAKALADLLNTTQVTSADFNTIKALVKGDLDTYMGFKFKKSQRLLTDTTGAAHARVPVWVKSGVLMSTNPNIQTEIARRPDKRFSVYVYAQMGAGGTRMEEKKVVEIKCLS